MTGPGLSMFWSEEKSTIQIEDEQFALDGHEGREYRGRRPWERRAGAGASQATCRFLGLEIIIGTPSARNLGYRKINPISNLGQPESMTGRTIGPTDAAQRKLEWASSAAAVVQRFAETSVVKEPNQDNVHRPANTFTIAAGYHVECDGHNISLHPIGGDNSNTYEIYTHPPGQNAEYGFLAQVTFTDATGGQILLPSRRYFQLHDPCAKVGHFSGAGEVMEQLFQDVEDIKVLAGDGGSHDLLSFST
ncbi:uncharacterized protein BT62DRAFT_1005895 [Guyanagaster necrorhizus]|uniref:Uncharacterized protein n=1 Tax=Guyanagaster necrorhizus TaxID=856835 RepID=A0A9P7VSH0_9AGAR|nr:uncharacterized protein BT62DRAFT_1005895 [Guyanagaster necrorhizus MCA 3950]KAG7446608.1 hypothetical protein BT62DRAFT_1005895 [Guyanagaster necrorhizus MCA 3950]